MGMSINTGVARIKNVSGNPYDVEEMPGVTIPDQGEIDLLDPALPSHYTSFDDVQNLLTNLPNAKLRRDIDAGLLEVVECTTGGLLRG